MDDYHGRDQSRMWRLGRLLMAMLEQCPKSGPGVATRRVRADLQVCLLLATLVLVRPPAAPAADRHDPATPPARDFTDQISYKVNRVIDGDTLELVMSGRRVKVRLVGIDTPEYGQRGRPAEPYAHEATEALRKLCENASVYLEYDPLCARKDRYGRTLGHLFRAPDGLWLNLELVRSGMARVYDKYPFSYPELFHAVQDEAQATKLGVWGGRVPSGSSRTELSKLVYVTARGRAYHSLGCSSLQSSGMAITLAEANQRGLAPCKRCLPSIGGAGAR